MKARVIATGEIVEVKRRYLTNLNGFTSIRYVDQKTGISYFKGDLDFDIEGKFAERKQGNDYTPDYWTRLEHQAMIAAMQGIVSNSIVELDYEGDEGCIQAVAAIAYRFAHALVEKMKEERK